MKLGVLASGRGSNLGALIDATRDGRLQSRIALVISDVEDARALVRAHEAGIPARFIPPGTDRPRLSPTNARRYVDALAEHHVDLVCLAGFMRVVGRTFFARYRGRILNIHPSLLPAFRGLHAQRQALEAGVDVAGCTAHVVSEAVDAGPILMQARVAVRPDDTERTLSERILAEEHRIYVETIRAIETGDLDLSALTRPAAPTGAGDEGAVP